MIENSRTVLADIGILDAEGVETRWTPRKMSAEPPVVRGQRILVVDDQQPVRSALRMMLELDGHQVTEAGDGAEALHIFAMGEFDLVITDFEMPMLKGNQLAVRIKLLAPCQPILMITASEGAHGDVENPVDALLDKPFTMADLRYSLGKLLSARPALAEPVTVPNLENASAAFAAEGQMVARLQA